jgi:hypothetical protein
MFLAINTALILIILLLFLGGYYRISRRYYFDLTIYQLRALRHDTLMHLSHLVATENCDPVEVLELRKMLDVFSYTLNRFDQLQSRLFRYKSLQQIFLNIDRVARKADREVAVKSPKIVELKMGFLNALYTAFCTSIFFRHKLVVKLFFMLTAIAVRVGMNVARRRVRELQYIVRTYNHINKSRNALSC